MKKIFIVLAAAVSVATVLSGLPVFASANVSKEQSGVAPAFTLNTISGKSVSLSDFKGKGVILFFYATWCPWCRKKFPELIANYSKYKSEGIELLVIDTGESPEKVRSFAQKQGLPFDVLVDPDMNVSGDFGVVGIPTFILINRDGRVVFGDNDLPSNYSRMLEL